MHRNEHADSWPTQPMRLTQRRTNTDLIFTTLNENLLSNRPVTRYSIYLICMADYRSEDGGGGSPVSKRLFAVLPSCARKTTISGHFCVHFFPFSSTSRPPMRLCGPGDRALLWEMGLFQFVVKMKCTLAAQPSHFDCLFFPQYMVRHEYNLFCCQRPCILRCRRRCRPHFPRTYPTLSRRLWNTHTHTQRHTSAAMGLQCTFGCPGDCNYHDGGHRHPHTSRAHQVQTAECTGGQAI